MLLRTLLSNYLREQAKSRLFEEVQKSATRTAGDPETPPAPCDIAILFALPIEAGGLVDLLQEAVMTRCQSFVEHAGLLHGRRVVLVEAGPGRADAELATAEAISVHHPRWLIAAGFATALREELHRGHFLFADEVVDIHGGHLPVDLHVRRESLAENPSFHVGRLLTIDQELHSLEEKRRIGDNHAAAACDMESMAIAKTCHEQATPFISVRIITEALLDEMPKDVERVMEQKTLAGKLGAAAGALWNRPSTAKDMWQLKEDAITASDRLAKLLAGVVENLPMRE